MLFVETRGNDASFPKQVKFSDAILAPIASFGGIYSPETMPKFGPTFLQDHLNQSYKSLTLSILNLFEVDIDAQTLQEALALYDRFDDPTNPVPLVNVGDNVYVSELFHGPTRAFKDMALQPFGYILASLAKQRQQQYLILAATSGDTGPAALETFKNCENIQVVCLYPEGGTSDVQRLQMVTESAPNLKVIGIKGDFDDAQAALKYLLASPTFKQQLNKLNVSVSAANSVNFGRIIFQIMYHIHSYLELVRENVIELGDRVYLNIPSGNFGNALGAYYARKMGLPIERVIVSSNVNNVLTELINTGKYDISEKSLVKTTSPAMDILKSSNVERILFDLFGSLRTHELMRQLDEQRFYQLEPEELATLKQIFIADFCTDEQSNQFIQKHYAKGYLMDPHTATCFKVYDDPLLSTLPSIVYSTAEWTKFSSLIDQAITGQSGRSDREALESISTAANIGIPAVIQALFDKPVCHSLVIDKHLIEDEILRFMNEQT
jgi:threonine synthase|tara:strand:- start:4356 stop:5837 length:1482 start_codon:yes stop_codon:yes gene_type:complete